MIPGLVRYWPGILLGWVGFKLIAHSRTRATDHKPAFFSSRETVLLVAVILVGSLITVAANISSPIGRFLGVESPNDVWEVTGNYFRYTEHHEIEAPPDSFVDISNLYGDVKVTPSTDNRVILDVNKSVRARSPEEADRMVAQFAFEIVPEAGSNFRIRSQRGSPRQRYKSSLIVRVPANTSVRVTNKGGNVTVAGVAGNQEIHNSFGVVALRAITGSVRVENPGGVIDLEDISSDAAITRGFESLKTRNIRGVLRTLGD